MDSEIHSKITFGSIVLIRPRGKENHYMNSEGFIDPNLLLRVPTHEPHKSLYRSLFLIIPNTLNAEKVWITEI